jgi:hypothetical protein
MKATIKISTPHPAWHDVIYPVICKNPRGDVLIAFNTTTAISIGLNGECHRRTEPSNITWEILGYVPFTEPVTVTFEN